MNAYENFVLGVDGCEDEYIMRRNKEGALLRFVDPEVPTVTYTIGNTPAYMHYSFHRVDGPACIELDNDMIMFYITDRGFHMTTSFCEAAGMSEEETFMWVLRFGDELPTTIGEYYGENWRSMSLDEF